MKTGADGEAKSPESPVVKGGRLYSPVAVWILRFLVGAVFIFSGFAKGVDPWGFFYKLQDYLAVWHITFVSREVMIFFSAALSLAEFCIGVFILTGALRRVSVAGAAAMMLFMLPLTAWIALTDPVADCGCFGDAYVLSNTATFVKNVLLSAAVVYLWLYNTRVKGVITPMLQWLAVVGCVLYCLVISMVGFFYQPMVDFRPYPVGSRLVEDAGDDDGLRMVYERDGERRSFGLDELPDSTWTFVEREKSQAEARAAFAVMQGDDDVTSEVITSEGPELLLLVSDPAYHQRARASMANNLNDYITRRGGSMIAVVALPADSLDAWTTLTSPDFDVYSGDDTSIKEVARGAASMVYLQDGVIRWKRNIYSLPGDFPDFEAEADELESVYVVDSGTPIKTLTAVLVVLLAVLILLSIPCRKH